MKLRYAVAVLVPCLGVDALAAAASLKGTVRNGTTGQPAPADEVVLLSMAGSPAEIGRGKTDAAGRFRLAVDGPPAARLVRVIHQGVAYHAMAAAGAHSVEVQVYDVANKVNGVTAAWNVSLQTEGDTLQVIDDIAVRNASDPPRTLNRPFEIQLPPEAQIVAGAVATGGGQPVRHKPTPGGGSGRYYFPFPLPPGETRFAVAYQMPYRGEAMFEPKTVYPLQQVAVVLPGSMQFEPKTPGIFQSTQGKDRASVIRTAAVKPGQSAAFRISGRGRLLEAKGGQQQTPAGQTTGSVPLPAKSPSPLHNDRWVLLGGLALVLAAGTAGIASHKLR